MGYGSLNAPYWFMGMEEGTGGHEVAEANLRGRLRFAAPVMDLRTAHDADHLNWDICQHRNAYPLCWLIIAKITRALHGHDDWRSLERARDYVCERLGHPEGETFLPDLMPLPKPSAGHWSSLYAAWYPTLKAYYASVLPKRQHMFRELLAQHRPRLLLCYGRANYPHYKGLVEVSDWHILPDTNIHVARWHESTIVLTPFLGNGAISSRDVAALVDFLKAN
ncbi:MAG: hypothetical protein U0694_08940 [Anaerolineae bacterium]